MSDPRNIERLEQIYEEVLEDCPEYSDRDSIHYDLEHCEAIAKARFEREADPDWPTDED